MTAARDLLGPRAQPRRIRKAVILAAGRGRRMGALTHDRPKAALTVAGRRLVDWQIAALRQAGVRDIAVVTGHGADALADLDVQKIHNPLWARGSQVDSLLCATAWIGQEPVLVAYGDIVFHPSAALALLERPGEIVVAYDADHRWLWKRRFGDWLKDCETFQLAPGQILAEIGGRPRHIDDLEGQFMGLMLFTPRGLARLCSAMSRLSPQSPRRPDFTHLLSSLVARGERIDTAANGEPWMEIDSACDLRLARAMAAGNGSSYGPPCLTFPTPPAASPNTRSTVDRPEPDPGPIGAFAIQNWGRSGSTLLQSLFDDHPQVLSTPNFYLRDYYTQWARGIAHLTDPDKIDVFLDLFRRLWDPAYVDASAGLHRLGPDRAQVAGVSRGDFEAGLRAVLDGRPAITRRALFEAAHLAYARALRRPISQDGLQILFPVHGRSRAEACAFLEDYPEARLIHTVRAPAENAAACLRHFVHNRIDWDRGAVEMTLNALFLERDAKGAPRTGFALRPYLKHLSGTDHARFLRLEDLHDDPAGTMAAAASWLGVAVTPGLVQSTCDGKTWWNRPESGTSSRLGLATRRPPPPASPLDQRRWMAIASARPQLATLYPSLARGVTNPLQRIVWAVRRWRREDQDCQSAAARAKALAHAFVATTGACPAIVKREAEAETRRASLRAMNAGVGAVRRRLAPRDRSAAVDALLLLRATPAGWKMRMLLRRPRPAEVEDRVAVAFLDAEGSDRPAVQHLGAAGRSFAGWVLAKTIDYGRHRLATWRALQPEHAPPPLRRLAREVRD
jgi:choline kinase